MPAAGGIIFPGGLFPCRQKLERFVHSVRQISDPSPRNQTFVAGHQDRDADEGEDMGLDVERAREDHFIRMQKALEEGLKAIAAARTPAEADAARQEAQARMVELKRIWEEASLKEEVV